MFFVILASNHCEQSGVLIIYASSEQPQIIRMNTTSEERRMVGLFFAARLGAVGIDTRKENDITKCAYGIMYRINKIHRTNIKFIN